MFNLWPNRLYRRFWVLFCHIHSVSFLETVLAAWNGSWLINTGGKQAKKQDDLSRGAVFLYYLGNGLSCLWPFLDQFISTGPLDSRRGRLINQEGVCCWGVCWRKNIFWVYEAGIKLLVYCFICSYMLIVQFSEMNIRKRDIKSQKYLTVFFNINKNSAFMNVHAKIMPFGHSLIIWFETYCSRRPTFVFDWNNVMELA